MNASSKRVATRFLAAKGVSLIPDFKKALEDFSKGEDQPILDFIQRVIDLIVPPGRNVVAEWFAALGTAKRTAIKFLHKEGLRLLSFLKSNIQPKGDPEQWRQYQTSQITDWGKKLRTLEIALAGADPDREIKHGPFTIIPMPGVLKKEADSALEALDDAAEKIRAKFPQVLYGKVYLSTHLSKTTSAHYIYTDDTIHVSVRARRRFSDIYTIIHELGHRFDHKFLKDDLRKEYWALSTQKVYEKVLYDDKLRSEIADEAVQIAKDRKEGKPFLGMSDDLERWAKFREVKRPMADFLSGKLDEKGLHAAIKGSQDENLMTGKILHGPISVTPYGATKPTENFAEGFAHFVLGMDMPPELAEILAKI